ncbi:MAG: DUF218 domain-containing protein, partial [Myxococcales bacterium]|nr:DUF218 domain-containing protein [Myxococcales bacterium]
EPRNTSPQEIAAIAAWVKTATAVRSLGLLTSAWHLPRAMALAEREGLEVVAIAADVQFEASVGESILDYLPHGPAFQLVHRAAWETLGRAVGR